MISRSFVTAVVVTVLAAGSTSSASADEVTLMFATLGPPNGHANVDIFHPWAKHINEVGKGVLQIDVRDGYALANRNNFYSRVLNDVVQIAFGPQGSGSASGIFPRTSVLELPFEAQKSADSSVAFWRLYKTGLLDAEYKDIVPLWMSDVPQGSLHCVQPLKTLDNLDGLKILTPAKTQGEMIERLGGAPMSLPLEDAYNALQRRTVDCMYFPWTGVQTFKLADVTSHHVDAPLGGAGVMVFMARKKFESLPSSVRNILAENTGEALALKHGASLDKTQDEVRQEVKANPKQQVVSLSPQQEKLWRQRLASLAEAWAKSTPDGAKILDTYRSLLAKVGAEHRS
jgi:TRAP-type C4-dicarboxylate transport system substrate-binding protein